MAIKLPLLQGEDPVFNRYQTQLQTALSPITSNSASGAQQVIVNGSPNITLTTGAPNVIPIGLSATLQGWILTRNKNNAVIWDSQDSNPTPSQTLILNCSATTVIQILVY